MKRYLILILGLALLLALGVYESRLRPAAVAERLPTGEAEWIWASEVDQDDGWVNFFLYRDFDVGESVPDAANLVIQADSGYWVFVNTHAAGSGGFSEGAPLDSYDVAKFLRPGGNRLLVQVRSRRGIGGLLASLDLGEQGAVVTDGAWQMCRRYEAALRGHGFVPEDREEVKSWGRPPVGDWHVSSEVDRLPLLAAQLLPVQSAKVTRVRSLGRDWERRFPPIRDRESLGRWVIFDLGREVQGYINIAFADTTGSRGLVYTGFDRPTGPDSGDPQTYFSNPPGRGSWTDLQPRRFRFVSVLAVSDIAGLRVFETEPKWVEARVGATRSRRAFDFVPPTSAVSIEDEFWRELKRVTGLTGREAFQGGLSR